MTVLTLMPSDRELNVEMQQVTVDGVVAAAVFDGPDRTYRYLLTRIWDPSRPPAVFVMLNPSTADAMKDDATIRRLAGGKGFARTWGAGGVVVVNLFALRSTDPRALLRHPDPVGPVNDAFVRQAVSGARTVIAAWGAGGVQHDRAEAVTGMLGRTATGQPRHPLCLPKNADLEPYGVAA